MYLTVRFPRLLCFSMILFLFFKVSASAQTFNATRYDVGSGPRSLVRADFNNDGYADLATANSDGTATILLNNGDGTFRRLDAVSGSSGSGLLAAADLNGDHFIDLVVSNGSNLNVLYGRGDGTFNPPVTVASRTDIESITTADFNGDGKVDIAYAWNSSLTQPSTANVTILYNNGTSGWTAKDFTNVGAQADYANGESSYRVRNIVAGDFNGDGRQDFAIAECCGGFDVEIGGEYVYLNTGSSQFSGTPVNNIPPNELNTADMDQDGKMDLLVTGNGCHTPCTVLDVYEKFPNYTVKGGQEPNAGNRSTDRFQSAIGGDFMNTGMKMLGYSTQGYDYTGTGTENGLMSFAAQNADGSFAAPLNIPTGNELLTSLVTGDFNHDGKLDFSGIPTDATYSGTNPNQIIVYTNTTASAQSCSTGAARSVNVCAPSAGSTATSPVRFLATPFSTTAISGMKVYVDGQSAFVTRDDRISTLLPMSAGSHNITVKAWDTAGPFSKSFTMTVGSSRASCSASANRTVTICSPTSGSTVSSPVQVLAGLRSDAGIAAAQIYVDGTKVYQGPAGTTTVNQSLTMSAGTHKITVKGWDSAGSFSSSETITVGSSRASCSASANRTVTICSPTSGSTVSSPVQVLAGLRSDAGIAAAQIYLDGTKIYQGPAGTTTVDQSIAMNVGSHRVTVKGWDSSGSFSSSVTFTVK